MLGLSDKDTGRSVLNPDPATVIGPDDNLVLMRPSSVPSAVYQPLKKALHTDLGECLLCLLSLTQPAAYWYGAVNSPWSPGLSHRMILWWLLAWMMIRVIQELYKTMTRIYMLDQGAW